MTIDRNVAIVHDYDLWMFDAGLAGAVSDHCIPDFELNRESIVGVNRVLECLEEHKCEYEHGRLKDFLTIEGLSDTVTYIQFT